MLGLRWDCVNFESGILTISTQILRDHNKGGGYFTAPLKNDKMRTITPAPSIMAKLQNHKQKQEEMRQHAGDAWENSGLVFTNALGQHLKHVTIYKNYKRIVSSIGIPNARFHDPRHSYAVASIQAGDDIKTIQENLGHHSAAFTLDTYAHVTDKMKRSSAQRMEQYIQNNSLL